MPPAGNVRGPLFLFLLWKRKSAPHGGKGKDALRGGSASKNGSALSAISAAVRIGVQNLNLTTAAESARYALLQ